VFFDVLWRLSPFYSKQTRSPRIEISSEAGPFLSKGGGTVTIGKLDDSEGEKEGKGKGERE